MQLSYLKPWNIAHLLIVEHEKSLKKPEQGCSGYKLETTALIYINNYNAFRIICIMLILEKLKAYL